MSDSQALVQTVIFFREGMFYPVEGRANEDWAEHARLNPGTLRVESIDGVVLWPEGSKQ